MLNAKNFCIFPSILLSMSLLLVSPGLIVAQPLDTVVEQLLETGIVNCEGFTDAGGVAAVGSGLDSICSAPGGSGSSSGASASAPQTAPGIVLERLDTLRDDDGSAAGSGTVIELTPGLSLLLAAEYEKLDRDVTTFEAGYDSDINRFTLGADYQFSDTFLAGLAFSYSQQDGDFTGGGDFENDAFGVIGFLSFVPTDQVFIQATLGYADKSYDRTRQASLTIGGTTFPGTPRGDYDGTEYSGGISAGYDHRFGSFTFGPRVGVDWLYNSFDGYTESGSSGLELVFEDTSEISLQTRVGLEGSLALSTGFGVLVPQLSADWVHELENDQRTENFSFADDVNKVKFQYEDEPPDRNYFEVAAGVSAVFANGWQTYAQYRTILGHDYLDSHVGAVGVKIEF